MLSHKLSTILVVCACFLGMNLSLWGQNAAASHGILGYLDPRTGVFHSIPHPEVQDAEAEAPALTTFGGKFVATFTITVSSTIASTAKIGCEVSAVLSDAGSGNFIQEGAGSAVTRGTGSTVTCTVNLPYSWKLATGSTDMVSLSYSIQAPVAISTAAGEFPNRVSSQSLGTIKVPANGTTTNETITATI